MSIYRYALFTQDAKGQTVHQILTTQVKLEVQDYDIRGITREAGIVFEIACPWGGKFALFQLEDGKPTRILDESRRNGCLEHGGPPLASELEVDMTSKAMCDNNTFNLQPGETLWLGRPCAVINLGHKGPGPVTINLGDKGPGPVERANVRIWKVEDELEVDMTSKA